MDILTYPELSRTIIAGQYNHTPTWQEPKFLCSNLGHGTQGWNGCAGGIVDQSTSPSGYITLFMDTPWILQYDSDHFGPPLPPNIVHTLH